MDTEKSTDFIKFTLEGSFVYEQGELSYILFEEGMINMKSVTPEYNYYLKDHLGNTRVVFNDNNQILQQHDYYPFGMEISGQLGGDIKYRYNGKELQDESIGGVGLDWYDYGARMYDPSLGKWHSPDPLGEEYLSLSPYNYVLNNPLNYIDPFGLDVWTTSDPDAIRAFMNQLQSYGIENSQGEGWDRTSDAKFLQGLNYNDEQSEGFFDMDSFDKEMNLLSEQQLKKGDLGSEQFMREIANTLPNLRKGKDWGNYWDFTRTDLNFEKKSGHGGQGYRWYYKDGRKIFIDIWEPQYSQEADFKKFATQISHSIYDLKKEDFDNQPMFLYYGETYK